MIATLPPSALWILVLAFALALPLLPLSIVRWANVGDRRKEALEEKFSAAPGHSARALDKVAMVVVPGWPSMDEVVYEDESTGPTPVGFAFNAETVGDDIGGALTSRGIQVETLAPENVQTLDDLDASDAGIIVFPVRHRQLPWQVLAFFDQVVEPRVAARQSPLDGMPLVTVALGDGPEDVEAALGHLRELGNRYGVEIAVTGGLVASPDRLALYEQALSLADQIVDREAAR